MEDPLPSQQSLLEKLNKPGNEYQQLHDKILTLDQEPVGQIVFDSANSVHKFPLSLSNQDTLRSILDSKGSGSGQIKSARQG